MTRRDVIMGAATVVAVPGLVVVGSPRPVITLGAAAVMVAISVLLLIRAERAAVLAAALSIGIQLLVPILQISTTYGRLKYAVPALGALLPLIALARTRRRVRLMPVLLFGATLALYVPATVQHHDPNAAKLLWSTALVTVPLLALVTTFDAAQRLGLIRAVVWMALGESVYAYMEFFQNRAPLWHSYSPTSLAGGAQVGAKNFLLNDGSTRAQGTLAHPLVLGLLVGVALAAVLAMPIFKRRLRRWLVIGVLFGVYFVAGDRSFLVIIPLVAVFLAGQKYRSKVGRVLMGIPLLVVILAVAGGFGLFRSGPVTRLLSGESVTHRSASLSALTDLLAHQNPARALFGNGFYSAPRLYNSGILPNVDNTFAIDNMWVTAVAFGGAVSFLALLALVWTAARRADPGGLAMLAVIVGTFFAFDVYTWPSAMTLFAIVVGVCFTAPPKLGQALDDDVARAAVPAVAAAA